MPRAAFDINPTIVAEPWGRIEGVITSAGKPTPGASVLYFTEHGIFMDNRAWATDQGSATVDARGRFVLERVVPGEVRVARDYQRGSTRMANARGTLVVVAPGETARVEIGAHGRTVIARIARPAGFQPKHDPTLYSEFSIECDGLEVPYPKEVEKTGVLAKITWAKQWFSTIEGRAYRRAWFLLSEAKLQPDGSIRAEDVPPGKYRLRLKYTRTPLRGTGRPPERLATAEVRFVVPEGPADEPVDLGVLRP
jgi:hypothetical protein